MNILGYKLWSEFTTQHYIEKEKMFDYKKVYYYGDLKAYSRTEDFKTDWRFSKIEGKRNEAIFNRLVLHKNQYFNFGNITFKELFKFVADFFTKNK